MAIDLQNLNTTKNAKPPICVFYGVHGSGKTELASEFPNPLYVPTVGEEPPSGIDMPTPGTVETFGEILDVIEYLLTGDHDRETLIIDSLDGVEPLVWAETCAQNQWENIEEPGFGKGYVAADENWRDLMKGLQALRSKGIASVLIGHSEITRFDDPTSDPYSRYGIKLHKRAGAMVQESAQLVGFINYRKALKEKDAGFNKKVAHAEGRGERLIYLEERPGFLAKSRYPHPPSIPFKKGEGFAKLAEGFAAGE